MTRLLNRIFIALLLPLALHINEASAQQMPLPCVIHSPTQKLDGAIWKKIQKLDHAVACARYARMLTACHAETAIRRITTMQDELVKSFTISVQESGNKDELTGTCFWNQMRILPPCELANRVNISAGVPEAKPRSSSSAACNPSCDAEEHHARRAITTRHTRNWRPPSLTVFRVG